MVERDLQSVLDAVLEGIVVLDDLGAIERLNSEACRILETSVEGVSGGCIEEVVGADHAIARLVRHVLETGRAAIEGEVLLERRMEGDLQVDIAASPLEMPDRRLCGVVLMLRDTTVANSLRQMIDDREQLTSYGQIAAGIAHEVKNPLGGIRGAAELLQSWSADDRGRRTSAMIVREVDRIAALVEELMVFARGDEIAARPLNLHFVIDQVLELVALEPLSEKVDVERFYDPSIPEFLGDPDRLHQVFLNLVRNALQAMEASGGALTITTRMSLDQRLSDDTGHSVPTVVLAVSDTGAGISRENLDRLATPFFTTRAKGTGLGLAVSRHWVSRHGGALRINSQPGEGTTVRVMLPLRRERRKP